MKKNLFFVLIGSVIFALFALVVPAQDPDVMSAAGERYIISAKAGGTNFVEGTVTVVRKNGKSGYLLKGDQLEVGDRVTTGANGKVEILLNPGSYVRLGGNSGFEFSTTSLDDLRLKLTKGSAIFEVFASEDFRVAVEAPKGKVSLIRSGIYRIDVLGDGTARISVMKDGRAELNDSSASVVKSGRQTVINGTASAQIVKFDDDKTDDLDIWSKERSKELARISQQVQRQSMRTSLMRSFLGRGWNMYGSFGLWAYDPFFRSYCFLPFGYGWRSPYGWGFGPYIGWYDLPPVVYTPPSGGAPSQPTNTPLAQTPRGPNGRQPPLGGGGITPPFAQIQNDSSAGSPVRGGGGGRGRDIRSSPIDVSTPSGPVYSPPSAPVYSPPTTRSESPSKGKGN
jgi:hypothetical protein